MDRKVIFVLEGGSKIGYGHVKRSIVIAKKILQDYNKNILFVVNRDESVKQILRSENINFITFSIINPLENIENSIVIFDTKKQIDHIIEPLRNKNNKIILIDNITESRLLVDICIIPTVNLLEEVEWKEFQGKYYIDHTLMPINDLYLIARLNRENLSLIKPYKILITMGGSDPNNITSLILRSLMNIDIPVEIQVIVGPGFQTLEGLKSLEKNMPNIELFYNQNYLGEFMEAAHLAFTAVGTTVYELATVGVPTIVIANYEFDSSDLTRFADLGFNIPIGIYPKIESEKLLNAVRSILLNEKKWTDISRISKKIIDGKGLNRLVEIIIS